MRVIAGSARSVPLKTPGGTDVRPTTDRIKETLFNIIQHDVPGSVFIDIYAGSGAIGIEALSRGAAKAIFIDISADSAETIRYNLGKCRLAERASVWRQDAAAAVRRIPSPAEGENRIIFLDPPYGKGEEYRTLRALIDAGKISADTLIVAEQALNEDETGFLGLPLTIERVKRYKTQKHVFLKRDEP